MQKIRCNKTVFVRLSKENEWEEKHFDSISQAKKWNGLNSRTIQSPKNLPK